jgi:hypothetical protein
VVRRKVSKMMRKMRKVRNSFRRVSRDLVG